MFTIAGSVGILASPAYAATTYVVDADGAGAPGNRNAPNSAFTSISDAVDFVGLAPGDTIQVCPGEYNETVVINTPNITLRGAKAGVNGSTRVFRTQQESIINTVGTAFDAVDVNASGVTIDGFTIQNSDVGVFLSATTSGNTVRNNIIRNNVMGIYLNSDGLAPDTITRNKITANNNGFSGSAASFPPNDPSAGCLGPLTPTTHCGENPPASGSGNGIYSDQGVDNANITNNYIGLNRNAGALFVNCNGLLAPAGATNDNLLIASNKFVNNYSGVALFDNNNGVQISGNQTSDFKANNDLNWGSTFFVGGDNNFVNITGNTITQAPFDGVAVRDTGFCPGTLVPTALGIKVQNNTINGNDNNGVDVTISTPGAVEVATNQVHNNGLARPTATPPFAGADGIFFGPTTSLNSIHDNTSTNNGAFDCQDASAAGPGTPASVSNSWVGNTGVTSSPPGLCV